MSHGNPTGVIDAQTIKEVASTFLHPGNPDAIFGKIARKVASPEGMDETLNKMERLNYIERNQLMNASGVGSHFAMADAVEERLAPLFLAFTQQLIDEYGCTSPSEIAVAEMAAASYAQYVEASQNVRSYQRDPVIAKRVSGSQRQFFSALGMLRQMMRPPVAVNVITAQNAFVANNQVNAVKNEPDSP